MFAVSQTGLTQILERRCDVAEFSEKRTQKLHRETHHPYPRFAKRFARNGC